MLVLSVTQALCVNMKTVNMFVSLVFLSGALDACTYPSDISITTPQKMEALSGSCLRIPCTFTDEPRFDRTGRTTAMWLRDEPFGFNNPAYVLYESEKTNNKYPMNITGNLLEKNCTTEFFNLTTRYTHTYYFRIINSGFRATAACTPLDINVTDSPPRPTLEVSGNLTDLKEAESVTITCSAPTPCPLAPPRLNWSLPQDAHSQTEENTERTVTTKIQQNVTLSDRHDGFNLSCSAVYPVDGGERVKTAVAELTLSVSYAPKNTSASVSPSGLVSAGSWVNLTCSSRARPAVSYTWFKTSDGGDVRVSDGDFYSFNVTEGGVYYCVAANVLGNQTSTQIHLNVKDSPLHLNTVGGLLIGLIVLICLIICICTVIRWRRTKNTNSTVQVGQSPSGEVQAGDEPAGRAEDEGEDIHYGEINFSKHQHEPSRESSESRTQEDTVYAEVKASQPANSSMHTADDPQDLNSLYAEVKTK